MNDLPETPMKKIFPITIRMSGVPIARLHADGRCEGKIEAIQTMLANLSSPSGEPHMHGILLWVVLHALLNQRIIGSSDLVAEVS